MSQMESELDFNQLRAFTAFRRGFSLTLLGGAGSGKSFLLSHILRDARKRHGNDGVLPCAWTNQAACAISGRTVHSWFGVRSGYPFDKEELWQKVKNDEVLCNTLIDINIIFIDEISVLKNKVLDAIDLVLRHTARTVRMSCMPMGGRQLVVAGDPFQLEPIGVNYGIEGEKQVFSSRAWMLTFGGFGSGVVAFLHGNHRQGSDGQFLDILNRIRLGTFSQDDISRVNKTSAYSKKIPRSHTVLCLMRHEVDAINEKELSLIMGPDHRSEAYDIFNASKSFEIEKRLQNYAPRTILVKPGCEVIVTRKSGNIVPGTRATVVSVRSYSETGKNISQLAVNVTTNDNGRVVVLKPVKYELYGTDGSVMAYREHIPIVSAYALTIHRSQGMTLEKVAIDFGRVGQWVPNGIAYVALSRCKSMDGLWVSGLEKRHITINKHAIRVIEDVEKLKLHFGHRVISSSLFQMHDDFEEITSCGSKRKNLGNDDPAVPHKAKK